MMSLIQSNTAEAVKVAQQAALYRVNKLLKFLSSQDFAVFENFIEDMAKYPASSEVKHHSSYPGGLLVHSVLVMEVALSVAEALSYNEPQNVVMALLLHDVGKIGQYTNYESDKENKRWLKVKQEVPHQIRSLLLASKELQAFKVLPEEVWQAVAFHGSAYSNMAKEVEHKEFFLTLIIQLADKWANKMERFECN